MIMIITNDVNNNNYNDSSNDNNNITITIHILGITNQDDNV